MADQSTDIREAILEAILKAEITIDQLFVSEQLHHTLSLLLRDLRNHASKIVCPGPDCTDALLPETLRILRSVCLLDGSTLETIELPLSIHVYLSKAMLDLQTPVDPELNQRPLEDDTRSAILALDQRLSVTLEKEAYERIWDEIYDLRRAVNIAGSGSSADTLCVVQNLLHSLTKSPQAVYKGDGFVALSLGLQWCTRIVAASANSNNAL
jgi:hypothetical protein